MKKFKLLFLGYLLLVVTSYSWANNKQLVELDADFLAGCLPEIGKLSCDGKVYLGADAGHGLSYFPDNILDGPSGGGEDKAQIKEETILSLGTDGFIVLKFSEKIFNKEGVDFKVFENAFYLKDGNGEIDPFTSFTEVAKIEVSQDGVNFHSFPAVVLPLYMNPNEKSFLAGLFPTIAKNLEEALLPNEVNQKGERVLGLGSGGDEFDLSDLKSPLPWIQYIKIIDGGHKLNDLGNNFSSFNAGGFDLDGVVGLQ